MERVEEDLRKAKGCVLSTRIAQIGGCTLYRGQPRENVKSTRAVFGYQLTREQNKGVEKGLVAFHRWFGCGTLWEGVCHRPFVLSPTFVS